MHTEDDTYRKLIRIDFNTLVTRVLKHYDRSWLVYNDIDICKIPGVVEECERSGWAVEEFEAEFYGK